MDTVRRILGVLLIVGLPPAVLYWLMVHPFVGFWRRVGPRVTYTVVAIPVRRHVPGAIHRARLPAGPRPGDSVGAHRHGRGVVPRLCLGQRARPKAARPTDLRRVTGGIPSPPRAAADGGRVRRDPAPAVCVGGARCNGARLGGELPGRVPGGARLHAGPDSGHRSGGARAGAPLWEGVSGVPAPRAGVDPAGAEVTGPHPGTANQVTVPASAAILPRPFPTALGPPEERAPRWPLAGRRFVGRGVHHRGNSRYARCPGWRRTRGWIATSTTSSSCRTARG